MVNTQIRVLVAEDHEITRTGLCLTLGQVEGIEVVGDAADGQSAAQKAISLRPDVVLMDIRMPTMDGIESTRSIKESLPDTKVLILTSYADDIDVIGALDAGADGYCLKTINKEKLVTAIQAVYDRAAWLDQEVAGRILRGRLATRKSEGQLGLSEREMEVLRLIVEGLTNQGIADRLCLSVETIKTHVRHVMEKLGVSDRTQAAVKAIQVGLVESGARAVRR